MPASLKSNLIMEVYQLLTAVFHRFIKDHCSTHACALAFSTLLALVPLFAVVVSTLSMFPVFESWLLVLEEFTYQHFVPTAGETIRTHLHQFSERTRELTAAGVILLLLTALLLLSTIEEVLNKIWRVHRGRSPVQRVLAYWAVITLGPVLIGASLSLSTHLLTAANASQETRSILLIWLPFIFETAAFTVLYIVMPNRSIRLVNGVAAGLIAAVFFEISKLGFSYFIVNVASYEVIYGTLATIPVFLIWLYLSWMVILLGAEFCAFLEERYPALDDV